MSPHALILQTTIDIDTSIARTSQVFGDDFGRCDTWVAGVDRWIAGPELAGKMGAALEVFANAFRDHVEQA